MVEGVVVVVVGCVVVVVVGCVVVVVEVVVVLDVVVVGASVVVVLQFSPVVVVVGCVVVVVGCVVVVVGCVVVVVEVVELESKEPVIVEAERRGEATLTEISGGHFAESVLLGLTGNDVVAGAANDVTSVVVETSPWLELFRRAEAAGAVVEVVVVTGAEGSETPRFDAAAENAF